MAIGTGAVSMSDIRTEWGRSGAISMSEMYRGGSHVRSKAANNTGTNLASTVPESGVIRIDDFRGSAAGFRYTFTATATNQNASDLFGDDYAVDYRKEIVINSGVELGATSTAEEALEIDSGGAGTIVVTNHGTLSGAGGAAGSGQTTNGAAGSALQGGGMINNGYGGGGGGGYYGGSSGSYADNQANSSMAGGGGGSGYIGSSLVSNGVLYQGSGQTPGNSGSSYRAGAGDGGGEAATGDNGRVVILY